MQIRQGALHLAVPMLYISTKGGAPYRGEGGLHGANHNEVEGNNVTISKDEMFSFWEKIMNESLPADFIKTTTNGGLPSMLQPQPA